MTATPFAVLARIPLNASVAHAAEDPKVDGRDIDGLTAGEREVLDHVVAGRTYAEIARDLFISQTTVGVHVSNLLRKTGTSSRIELADRAKTQDVPVRPELRGPAPVVD